MFVNIVFVQASNLRVLGCFRMLSDLDAMLALIEQLHHKIRMHEITVEQLYRVAEANNTAILDDSIRQTNTLIMDQICFLRKLESAFLEFSNFTYPYTRKDMYKTEMMED
jgi:hypothetical protein